MPTTTLDVMASGDDGIAARSDTVYPPVTNPVNATNAATIGPDKSLGAGTYTVRVVMMRWDTSALPGGAVLTAATLRIQLFAAAASIDSRSLVAEWYPDTNWPIDDTDWTDVAVGDAHAGTALSTFTLVDTDYDLALTDLGKINQFGYTGIRLHISGGQPTGGNVFQFQAFDHATAPGPRLILTYDLVEAEGNPGTRYRVKTRKSEGN